MACMRAVTLRMLGSANHGGRSLCPDMLRACGSRREELPGQGANQRPLGLLSRHIHDVSSVSTMTDRDGERY
jgi:hypothetical protein